MVLNANVTVNSGICPYDCILRDEDSWGHRSSILNPSPFRLRAIGETVDMVVPVFFGTPDELEPYCQFCEIHSLS